MKKSIIILFFSIAAVCFSACQKTEQLQIQTDTTVPETTDDKEGMTFSHGDWIAERENVTIDGREFRYIKYRIKPAKEIVIDGIATNEDELIIPKEIQGYPVKALGTLELEEEREPVILKDQNKLNKIIVPEGVETIGESAFEKVNAKEIFLPETLKEIGENAFLKSKITYVKLKSNNTTLGTDTFADSNLKNINLPDNFSGCFKSGCFQGTDLEVIQWPRFDGIDSINHVQVDSYAFYNCRKLNKIIFSENQEVIKIPSGCFNGCVKLRQLVFPETTKKVKYGSQSYGENYTEGGPDTLVFLGSKTEWGGIKKADGREILTIHTLQAPKNSKAVKKAKKAFRVSWVSDLIIKNAKDYAVSENLANCNKEDVKFAPLEYKYLK